MSEIDVLSNPVLQGIVQTQQDRAALEAEQSQELGQDAFLQLMIAQLENQNPLDPQDNGEFISQLAEFSTVEGITNINDSIGLMVDEFRSSRTLDAANLVGKSVEIDGNAAAFSPGDVVSGSYALGASSPSVTLTVRDAFGSTVYQENLGTVQQGEHQFSWDGTSLDGGVAPQGNYSISVSALVDGESAELPVRTADSVQSVYLDPAGSVVLNLASGRSVPVDEVRRLSDPVQNASVAASAATPAGSASMSSYDIIAATALIGQSVTYEVSSLERKSGDDNFKASVDVPASTKGGTFEVKDSAGNLVYSESIGSSGAYDFEWDGSDGDGNALEAGQYSVSFTGEDGSAIPLVGSSNVESAGIKVGGSSTVTLANGQSITLDSILSSLIS